MEQSAGSLETTPNNNPADSEAGKVADPLARPSRNQRKAVAQSQPQQPPLQQQRVREQTPPQQPKEEKFSLNELFADGDSDSQETDEGDDTGPVDTMDRMTKRLGLTPEQAYAIKIPMPDGAEPLTIGEIKDKVSELVTFEQRSEQWEQQRIKSEGELLRAQGEMRALLEALPKEAITDKVIELVRNRQNTAMKRERALTLQHISAWQDEETREKDLEGMITYLQDWGFGPEFIATVQDHRALKFIRDNWLRDKRIKAALGQVTTPAKKAKGVTSGNRGAPSRPNSQQKNASRQRFQVPTQMDRIANLFNSES